MTGSGAKDRQPNSSTSPGLPPTQTKQVKAAKGQVSLSCLPKAQGIHERTSVRAQ